ncbi:MAG TPA: T9SS type A sorting domain-containing protein, partial [Agriterribacter sp.]|nr:T9SS type A sorting domain-containing protein [Agriterribacter sp.]
ARYTGAQWIDMNTLAFTGTPGSNGLVISAPINEFGSFTLAGSTAYPNNPLPVLLTEWEALPNKNSIVLQWKTPGETRVKGYIVEKSANGIQFEPLFSFIPAAKVYPFSYQLVDKAPFYGNNYYRLKMIDADGSALYSGIIAAILPASTAVKVYPNPAREKIFIKMPASSSISTLAVVNISGSVVKWINTRNLTIVSVNVLNLSPGLYYIKNLHGQSSLVVPFIKYNQ